MTTPASFNSPARLIEYAMQDAGLLQRGQAPDSQHYADYGNRLLDLINLWQTQGLKLWLQRDLPIPLTAGTASYSLSPTGSIAMTKPMRVLQAFSQNTSGARRPLTIISRDEYSRLSSVTQQGAINSVFVDKQQLAIVCSFWLVPDTVAATEVAHVILQYQVTNFTNLTEGIEFPQEWFLALRWGLADDICGGQSVKIMERCSNRANTFRAALEDWDVEDAPTFFQADSRGQGFTSGFR